MIKSGCESVSHENIFGMIFGDISQDDRPVSSETVLQNCNKNGAVDFLPETSAPKL